MHQWIEGQPDKKGLTSDFETYFKSLSDIQKEVCIVVRS